ncbi:CsgG/HfaB family protein [Desulfoluna sp.]|uniref:CsgG/HfaB family protein n=1 Tax=Desulfoluna sp. TaxID=2045199 RepID=UPI00261E1466|nr:CsgG/HfaB family protein [Desulfoluna sp.]
MKNLKIPNLLPLSFIFLILLSGCSTVKVPITVTHPAEINMKGYEQIAIAEISGNLGNDFANNLKHMLVESGRFKVVDRNRMKTILRELKLSQSDLMNPKKRAKLGKLMNASALITGRTDGKYREDVSSEKKYYKDKHGNTYESTIYTRKGIYSTTGGIDVIDVQTGELIRSKSLKASRIALKSESNAKPEMIDKEAMLASAVNENASDIIKAITPWNETIDAEFIKVKEIPALEKGINCARLGKMDRAINIFRTACKDSEMNSELKPKEISETYWNLGVALEYTEQFDEAIMCFEKGFEIYPNKPLITANAISSVINLRDMGLNSESKFITQIVHVKLLKKEKSKLEEQL